MTISNALEKLKQNGPVDCDLGICANIYSYIENSQETIMWSDHRWDCFRAWGEFSGHVIYPISANRAYECSPSHAFDSTSEENMWDKNHPYGAARLRLLDHCIEWFKNIGQ